MIELYAHRWSGPHGESVDADRSSAGTWAKGLAGLTGQQIAHGLQACIVRADPWPPTLPEFRALCLNIPSLTDVQRELAHEDSDRSGFTVLTYSLLDGYAYRRAEGKAGDRMLKEAYDAARERVMRGEPLPEPRVALPPPAPVTFVPAKPEVARAALAELAALFPKPNPEPEPEPEPGE